MTKSLWALWNLKSWKIEAYKLVCCLEIKILSKKFMKRFWYQTFAFSLCSLGSLLCSSGILPTCCPSPPSSSSLHYERHGQTPAGTTAHWAGAESLCTELWGGRHRQLWNSDSSTERVWSRRCCCRALAGRTWHWIVEKREPWSSVRQYMRHPKECPAAAFSSYMPFHCLWCLWQAAGFSWWEAAWSGLSTELALLLTNWLTWMSYLTSEHQFLTHKTDYCEAICVHNKHPNGDCYKVPSQ